MRDISIHAPARGATFLCRLQKFPLAYFNPRSREGSDQALHRMDGSCTRISIHAPARGATRDERTLFDYRSRFQSTLPRGERRYDMVHITESQKISIHAPARGATHRLFDSDKYIFLFQSTLPRGERQKSLSQSLELTIFQSTLPRGERPLSVHRPHHLSAFQSTLPRGERQGHVHTGKMVLHISIHAPARGATYGSPYLPPLFQISIHAPARGATYANCGITPYNRDFNPRSREGSDTDSN